MEQNQIEQSIRLQKLIKALNLKQTTFAQSLGIKQPNISRMISGQNKISAEVLNRISNTHKTVNLHWLLTGEGEMFLDVPAGKNTSVDEPPTDNPGKGKGRLEELEERLALVEEEIKQLRKEIKK
ncbi:MAG TPA: helix-turn-helix transcriptional regulator [Saprospiraceae bacterium]|nr:helix-turn-helix transcriptional regulator [Saprospiraceae bacterium]